MESSFNGGEPVVCPICTLTLNAGMSLLEHLETHSKQKVIEALLMIAKERNGICTNGPWERNKAENSNKNVETNEDTMDYRKLKPDRLYTEVAIPVPLLNGDQCYDTLEQISIKSEAVSRNDLMKQYYSPLLEVTNEKRKGTSDDTDKLKSVPSCSFIYGNKSQNRRIENDLKAFEYPDDVSTVLPNVCNLIEIDTYRELNKPIQSQEKTATAQIAQINKNFENILIITVVVAIIIVYLKIEL